VAARASASTDALTTSLTGGCSTNENGPPRSAAVLRSKESIEFSRKLRSVHVYTPRAFLRKSRKGSAPWAA